MSMTATMSDLLVDIEHVLETGETRTGLMTGFPALDTLLTGFYPGQLILLAARPSMGKSALAQNIAENLADAGIPSAFASLEMSKLEIAYRSIARVAKIPTHRLRTGEINHTEVAKFTEAKKKVLARAAYFHVEDNASLTVSKLRAELKRMKRQQPLGLAIVDYLQMMVAAKTEENRQAQVSEISRSLKVLARELEIPILALAQLNRNLEGRTDKRPVLSDLRDSGSLEQDADVVLFIYRDEFYNPDSDAQGVAEIIVAKNRNGEAHKTVSLGFSGRLVSFLPLPKGGES
jgi:replicative DNA helicase